MTRFGWFSAAFGVVLLLAALHPAVARYVSITQLFFVFVIWYSLTMFVGLRSLKRIVTHRPGASLQKSNDRLVPQLSQFTNLTWLLVQALWPLQLTIYSVLALTYAGIWFASEAESESAVYLLKSDAWVIIFCVASLLPATVLLVFGLCLSKTIADKLDLWVGRIK